jgi:hypothetical protein
VNKDERQRIATCIFQCSVYCLDLKNVSVNKSFRDIRKSPMRSLDSSVYLILPAPRVPGIFLGDKALPALACKTKKKQTDKYTRKKQQN